MTHQRRIGSTDRLLELIEADIADWYTIAPTHRTKERLINMVRASFGIPAVTPETNECNDFHAAGQQMPGVTE